LDKPGIRLKLYNYVALIVVVLGVQACGSIELLDGPAKDEPIDGSSSSNAARQDMQKPTILALLDKASVNEQGGNLDGALADVERALRIDPRNAQLWHRMARIRLRQQRLQQATDLALKSNGYATENKALQAENWRLIYSARQRLGDMSGALDALAKARSLEE
jgi:tetratricopeptide (TPR) repeat protein